MERKSVKTGIFPPLLVVGEILYDVFPDYRRIGGAPFNFACHMRRFGFPVRFLTRVGDDVEGGELRRVLEAEGFDPCDVQVDRELPTGEVNVRLNEKGVPEFTILPERAYDRLDLSAEASRMQENPALVYYGTLIQRTEKLRLDLARFLDARSPRTRCFCDINLRPRCYGRESVKSSLARADVLKISEEEAETLQALHDFEGGGEAFARELMRRYPAEMLFLTRGDRGSDLFCRGEHYRTPSPAVSGSGDTVGAGDGYAAVAAAGYLLGWSPELILREASEFAARICGIRGALPREVSFYHGIRRRMEEGGGDV